MWFSRMFRRRKQQASDKKENIHENIGQGVFYLYLIVALQVVFVLGLVSLIFIVGKILATPWWVFLLALFMLVAGVVYIYRKAKQQFRRIRESFQASNMPNRNYEISFMGGMLTMRVQQNPRKLLNAPEDSQVDEEPPPRRVLDAEPVDPASVGHN
jgi:uncharacterized membrane protein